MSKTANPVRVASDKQIAFIRRLVAERENLLALGGSQRDTLDEVNDGRDVSMSDASYLIEGLMRCDKVQRKQAEPGYYRHDGKFIVVVTNRRGDNTYAKVLNVTKEKGQRAHAKWEYAPGLGYDVADLTPMTLAKAQEFGHLHGVCFVCTRALTKPESVKAGIGPVCAKKF